MRIGTIIVSMTVISAGGCSPDSGGAVRDQAEASASAAARPSGELANLSAKPVVHVWKLASCGCCAGWVEHLRAAGYPVEVEDVAGVSMISRAHGIPADLTSCHTALVDGYLVEGHVPADVIDRVLAERPAITGVAVPGMPVGSPGMEVPGLAPDRYDIVAFGTAGERLIYDRR